MSTQFIDQQQDLMSILPALKNSDQIAIDLEFDKNYYRYGFNLCLMQIFDGSTCYLVDPLSDSLDIEAIFPVLEDPAITKVSFAFGEDLRLLHSIGCFPKNIYDLDNAISILNYSPASLTNHLHDILGIDTGKSSQMSNWYRRPLSDEQAEYAAQDVLHLLELKKVLQQEADRKNVTTWIEQENRVMDTEDHSQTDDNGFLKEKDKTDLNEKQWHIFTRLMEAREEIAEKLNKPSFQVIKKSVIQQIVQEPQRLNRWTNTRGIFKRIRTEKMKQKLSEIVQEAEIEADKNGLSESEPASQPPSVDQKKQYREQREKINRAKSEFFTPIKQEIENDYGKEVTTFLFSNRIIAETVTQQRELLQYKRDLLEQYATKLDLDMHEYIEFSN